MWNVLLYVLVCVGSLAVAVTVVLVPVRIYCWYQDRKHAKYMDSLVKQAEPGWEAIRKKAEEAAQNYAPCSEPTCPVCNPDPRLLVDHMPDGTVIIDTEAVKKADLS